MDSESGKVVSLQVWREQKKRKPGGDNKGAAVIQLPIRQGSAAPREAVTMESARSVVADMATEAAVRVSSASLFAYPPLRSLTRDLRQRVLSVGKSAEDRALIHDNRMGVLVVFPDMLCSGHCLGELLEQPLIVAVASDTPGGRAALNRLRTCQIVARWRDCFGNVEQVSWYVPAAPYTEVMREEFVVTRFSRRTALIRTWALLVNTGQWCYEPLNQCHRIETAWLVRQAEDNVTNLVVSDLTTKVGQNGNPIWLRFNAALEDVP